jgi:hypothetical protein
MKHEKTPWMGFFRGTRSENQGRQPSRSEIEANPLLVSWSSPALQGSERRPHKRTRGIWTRYPARLKLAEWTGLEPATPGVTGRYSNQLNYHSKKLQALQKTEGT